MKICGASQRAHGFSLFVDTQLVPHHAFGKGSRKGFDMGARGRITAAHNQARLFPAGRRWALNTKVSGCDGAPPPRITRRGG